MEARIAELEDQMLDPSFWNDQQGAQTVINEANGLKDTYQAFHQLEEQQENLEVSLELLREELDADLKEQVEEELQTFVRELKDFELKMILSEPYDKTMRS
ncbi:Peptide chain release factor 2 [Listeria grayi]|uniref:Peptide chain release factor 2 n=1 Tax=Listeria grayi TaxID=1641 RepID=A0A378MF54_LISGR|nr:Peptide chain release factor 2 [Listeria grayi]